MAPPRKPAPKSAAPSSAPRGGGRARPPQGEANQGRGGEVRRAPAKRFDETTRDGNRSPAGADRGESRGRYNDDNRGNVAPRSPRGAGAGRGEDSRFGAEGGQRRPAGEGNRGRAPEGQAPRGPRGNSQGRAEEGRFSNAPRDGRSRPAAESGRGRPQDGAPGRGPRGAGSDRPAEDRQSRRGQPEGLHSQVFGSVEGQRNQPMDADARREARRTAARKPPVNIADLPVEPAKKMRMRHGSDKHERQALELREKRVEARYVGDLRIQKALALSGVGSRRDCDEWVAEGRVSINGVIAQPGARVAMGDKVIMDGKLVTIKWPDRLPRIVLYHKQEGELVSRDDPEGRTTVFERLPKVQSSAWIAVGRLDFNTSGLLIFTTSGDLANRLMHPRFEVQREYAVRVLGQLTDEQKKELVTGIALDDGEARFEMLEDQGGEGMNHWYKVILREGRNREVRRMFEHYELTVSRLMRVRFGMLTLPSRLKRGQYYELDEPEVLAVLKWAGLSLTGRVPTR